MPKLGLWPLAAQAPAAPPNTKPQGKAPAGPFAGVVLLLFVSPALRLPGTFLYPSFWAGGLTVLFKGSMEMGPAALGQPIFGSYHTFLRPIAFTPSVGPVARGPPP